MPRLALSFAFAVLLSGCASAPSPADQVILYVDTDALVPSSRPLGPNDPSPLFDRLRVEVYRGGEHAPCEGCTRDFPLNADDMSQAGLSFGVLAPPGPGARVRLRMYPHWAVPNNEPEPAATVEQVIALPDVVTGVMELNVLLPVSSLAHPVGTLDAPVAPGVGALTSSQVGTWPGARRVPCADPPRDGEACVPGGAFWMSWDWKQLIDTGKYRPHLVVLDPFYIALQETTVGEWRKSGIVGGITHWSGRLTGDAVEDYCRVAYSPVYDSLAANCIGYDAARKYCQKQGGDLPSEAQLEYLEGGLRSHSWVWGEDYFGCNDMVIARGGVGVWSSLDHACNLLLKVLGPAAPGSAARDRLRIGDHTVLDLNGNVDEWALDVFAQNDDDRCWPVGVLTNPHCSIPVTSRGYAAKGGSWLGNAPQAKSYSRSSAPADVTSNDLGFRCMRVARPGS